MMPARAQTDLAVTFVEPARKEFKKLQGSVTSTTGPLSTACSKALHFVHLLEKILLSEFYLFGFVDF